MRPSAPHLFFFTCPTPDDFTRQQGSSATKWVNNDLTFQLQLISKEFNNCVKKILEQDKNR